MKLKLVNLVEESSNKKNVKSVKITVPNEQILKRINSTPAFNRLSRLKLKVGENFENVNHTIYADMLRLYPIIGVTVEEV
jgi:DNA-binding TFAR19-related protein (PDSD5 family)